MLTELQDPDEIVGCQLLNIPPYALPPNEPSEATDELPIATYDRTILAPIYSLTTDGSIHYHYYGSSPPFPSVREPAGT